MTFNGWPLISSSDGTQPYWLAHLPSYVWDHPNANGENPKVIQELGRTFQIPPPK